MSDIEEQFDANSDKAKEVIRAYVEQALSRDIKSFKMCGGGPHMLSQSYFTLVIKFEQKEIPRLTGALDK